LDPQVALDLWPEHLVEANAGRHVAYP
jgi:hypothetical protein